MKGKDSLDTPYLVRNALKLGMAIAGQNISDYDKKTIKFASPRFFSIVPDDSDNNVSSVFRINVLQQTLNCDSAFLSFA